MASVVVAAATSVLGAALVQVTWALPAAVAHVATAAAALAVPPVVAAQVAAGLVLSWATLPGTDGPTAAVVPVVAGVVATAELVGLTARLGTVVARDPVPLLRRTAGVTVAAAVTAAVVVAAGAVGGPGGLAATLVAALACVAVLVLASGGARRLP